MIRTDGKPTIASSAPLARAKKDAAEVRAAKRALTERLVRGLASVEAAAAAVAVDAAPPPWTAIGLRLNPDELVALDLFRERGIAPLSRAEAARYCVRKALGLGKRGPR